MSRADGRHAAPRAQARAPTRADPTVTTPPAAGAATTGGKAGKKAANAGGDDSPPDGSALPLVDAQLAAAASLPLPVSPELAPTPAGTAAAASVDGTLAAAAAAAAAAAPTGPEVSTEAPASQAAAPPSADATQAHSPPPASGLARPLHAAPTGGEFRAGAERPALAAAPALPAPSAAPAPAVAPAAASVVAAAVPPPPTPASITDEFSMKTTPWTPTQAGTDGPTGATETARALAPVFATDTGNGTNTENGSTLGDGKPGANSVVPAALAPPMAPSLPASPVVAQVATPVGSPDWPQQLGDRVAVLVNQNLTNAQIKLSPAHLGPIEIRIAVSDGQANIAFTSHSQVTREALEAAAPKLREMLGGQGFAHVNVDVSQQQFRDRAPQSTRYEPEFSFAAGATAAPTHSGAPSTTRAVASSLRLDAYA